jgi:hypothetical protein
MICELFQSRVFVGVMLKCYCLFRGKNVCIYHILDSCKFGAARCVYSHSNEALPKRGWWNSSKKVAKVKEVLEIAERNAKEQRQVETVRWRTYVKEMRGEVRTRRASEKQKTKGVKQPPRAADIDKKHVGSKADTSEKKDGLNLKEGDEAAGEITGVQPEGENTGQTTLAGALVNSTTSSTKTKARREGKKKVIERQGDLKKTEGANIDASTTPTIPSAKKGPSRYHHRRRNPRSKAASSSHSSAEMAG